MDPALQPPVVRTSSDNLWLNTTVDRNGAPVMNKAKLPPWVTTFQHYHIPVYIATFYLTTFPNVAIRNYVNSVNSATWRTWTKAEAKVAAYHAEARDTNYGVRYRCQVQINCLRGGWQPKIANVGTEYLDGSEYKPVENASGDKYYGKLNSTGGKLAITSDVELLDVDLYRETDFNALGF